MHSRPTSTMSDSFFTHGLPGIDLHHAESQRSQSHPLGPGTTPIAQLRQLVANAFISAGNLLAGEDLARTAGNRLAT